MLKIPHCLENRLADGDEVVSPTHGSALLPNEHFSLCFSLCYSSKPRGIVRPEEVRKFIKFSYIIGSRTSDLPPRRTVPQRLRSQQCLNYCAPSSARTTALPAVPEVLRSQQCLNYCSPSSARTTALPTAPEVLRSQQRLKYCAPNSA
jgi:hypothetical protein